MPLLLRRVLISMLWLFGLLRASGGARVVRVGLLATAGGNQTELFKYMFETVVGDSMGPGYIVNLVPLNSTPILHDAVRARDVDFIYTSPVDSVCLQLEFQTRNIASRVDTSISPFQLTRQAGVFVRLASRDDIEDLPDMCGKIMGAAGLNILTSPLAQWAEMKESGLDLFTCMKSVFFTDSIPSILTLLLTGVIDVAAVPANLKLPPQVTVFHIKNNTGSPIPVSTRLYPQAKVAVLPDVPHEVAVRFTSALLLVPPNSTAARTVGNYWTIAQSDVESFRLMIGLKLVEPPFVGCPDLENVLQFTQCPDGYMFDTHHECPHDIVCPSQTVCLCSPCVFVQPSVLILSLMPAVFAVVLAVSVLVAGLGATVVWRRLKFRVELIPFQQVCIVDHETIRETATRRVFQGVYGSDPVIVRTTLMLHSSLPWRAARTLAEWLSVVTRRKRLLLQAFNRSRIQHPNVVQVLGASLDPQGNPVTIARYAAGGTLYDLLSDPTFAADCGLVLAIARDVARGLQYLHMQQHPIVGASVSSHHIFVDGESFSCMLAAYGNGRDETDGSGIDGTETVSASTLYTAPEIQRGEPPTIASDVYGWARLTRDIIYRTFDGSVDLDLDPPSWTSELPPDVKSLLQRCLAPDPTVRPNLSHVLGVLNRFADRDLKHFMDDLLREKGLLRQILPERTITAIHAGRRPSAQSFDCVTIYFSDVKGFTAMCSSQPPFAVMKMLDTLYSKFDDIARKYHLSKIETIGDSYMLVGGLRVAENHTARVAAFALEANVAASTVSVPGVPDRFVTIRSGFHAGPVTAGVVGRSVPRFCLFGNAVNIASRMESTGAPSRIQMTEEAASLLLAQNPSIRNRVRRRTGQVQVKGRSPMRTFWLCTDEDLHHPQEPLEQEGDVQQPQDIFAESDTE